MSRSSSRIDRAFRCSPGFRLANAEIRQSCSLSSDTYRFTFHSTISLSRSEVMMLTSLRSSNFLVSLGWYSYSFRNLERSPSNSKALIGAGLCRDFGDAVTDLLPRHVSINRRRPAFIPSGGKSYETLRELSCFDEG